MRCIIETPLERIVYRGARVAAGEWRCAPDRPEFRDSGPIHQYLVAFPRTSVAIRHAGGRAFIADPLRLTIYNRGQCYTREVVDPAGDQCDWWSVDPLLAAEMAGTLDRRVGDDGERLFRVACGPADAALYRRQRALRLRLAQSGATIEPLDAEEAVVDVVAGAVASACRAIGADGRARTGSRPAHRDAARAALAFIGARYRERLALDTIAAQAGVTPYHLCRVFRAETGNRLHQHQTRLRLRAALEPMLERDADLTQLALDLGYSSHSHFTAAFAREFGLTPTAWRAEVRAGRQRADAAAASARRV